MEKLKRKISEAYVRLWNPQNVILSFFAIVGFVASVIVGGVIAVIILWHLFVFLIFLLPFILMGVFFAFALWAAIVIFCSLVFS